MPTRHRFLIVHNPIAGRRRRALLRAVVRELESLGGIVTERETAAAGEGEGLARAAAQDEFDMVVAAGGDGTVNEVANGLDGSALPLGLIPLGTANVLAAEIGLPAEARTIAATLADAPLRRIYPGRLNGRRFMLMAGIGLDAEAVATVDPALKRFWGHGAYLWSAFRSWLRYRPPCLHVVLDGEATRTRWLVVAKGRHYAGRFVFAADARLWEPVFQVCLLDGAGRRDMVRYGLGLLTGRVAECRDVRIVPAASVSVAGPAGVPIQTDGDAAGATPVEISVDEGGLLLAMPKDEPT